MEYFHLGIFVIPWVYLIRKYGSQTQAFFFAFHRFFDTVLHIQLKANDVSFKKDKEKSYLEGLTTDGLTKALKE